MNKTLNLLVRQRRRKNMKQTELAEILGYQGSQYVSNIERGVAPIPLNQIAKWARVLDIPKRPLMKALISDYKAQLERRLS